MLSIIIPSYNEEKIIAVTLQRLRQGLTAYPYEIIVSDDQSTDNTAAQARLYTEQVVLCPPGSRKTIAAARNRGAAVAKYDYLVFIDSDTIIPELNTFFKRSLHLFQTIPNLAGLTSQLYVNPNAATRTDNIMYYLVNVWVRFATNILKFGLSQGKFQMIPKIAFAKVGGYSEHLVVAEDNELFYKLSRIGRTRLEPSLIVYYSGRRVHAIGWPRLLYVWITNALSVALFKHAIDKEWKAFR